MADLEPADWEVHEDTPPTEYEEGIAAHWAQLKKEQVRTAFEVRLVAAKVAVASLEEQIAELCADCEANCACGHGDKELPGDEVAELVHAGENPVVIEHVTTAVVEDNQRLAKDVVVDIEKAETAEGVEELAKDDDRATVRKAAEKRLDELKSDS